VNIEAAGFPQMQVTNFQTTLCHNLQGHLFVYVIYIPWVIRGKFHLDIGIVNIDMDVTRQMYIQYEYKYGIRKQIIVR